MIVIIGYCNCYKKIGKFYWTAVTVNLPRLITGYKIFLVNYGITITHIKYDSFQKYNIIYVLNELWIFIKKNKCLAYKVSIKVGRGSLLLHFSLILVNYNMLKKNVSS